MAKEKPYLMLGPHRYCMFITGYIVKHVQKYFGTLFILENFIFLPLTWCFQIYFSGFYHFNFLA